MKALFDQVEPLKLAHRLDPERTWMYTANLDQVVPPQHAEKLATAAHLSPKHHFHLWADHYTGIIYLPGVVETIAKKVRATPR